MGTDKLAPNSEGTVRVEGPKKAAAIMTFAQIEILLKGYEDNRSPSGPPILRPCPLPEQLRKQSHELSLTATSPQPFVPEEMCIARILKSEVSVPKQTVRVNPMSQLEKMRLKNFFVDDGGSNLEQVATMDQTAFDHLLLQDLAIRPFMKQNGHRWNP